MRAAIVVINPFAGGGRVRAALPQLIQIAGTLSVPMESPATPSAALALLAAQPPGTRVVMVGGDGTLHQWLPMLHERQHELALLPMGSGNDCARAFGVHPRRHALAQALRHALSAPCHEIDLAQVQTAQETRLFASSLALGFDAAVAYRALAGPGWLTGMPRYLLATLLEIATLRTARLRIEADGQVVHDGTALFASTLNTPTYGGGMPAVPDARIDDGRLDLLVAGRFGRAGTLLMLPRLLRGRHLSHSEVSWRQARELRFSSPAPLPLAADGEAMQPAVEVTVRVLPHALRVVRALDVMAGGAPG